MTKVNSINVCPAELTLAKGEWYYDASVSVCPESADCKEVTWSSDNTSVATVNPSTGYIYAQSNGVAKIYATAADGSGCNDYICLTVTDFVPVAAVYIKGLDIRIEKGSCKKLDLEIYPENATNKVFSWHSNNTSVATVEDGVVYGVSEGIAQICVVPEDGGNGDGGCQLIGVTTDVLVRSITISSSELTLRVGESTVLNAAVTPANATNSGLLWVSTNEKVVTVNPFSGIVNAIGEGTASIYAKSRDGSNLKSCYCKVTVEKVGVTSVTINPSNKAIAIGSTTTLTATVLPENATNKSVVWSVNPEHQHIVTVDPNTGVVTALSAGTAPVWATSQDDSSKYMCSYITVIIPVNNITVTPSSKTLNVGESVTLSATVLPETATNKSVTWSSDDTNVATVDSSTGYVIACNPGIANITASTIDGNHTKTCEIWVKGRTPVFMIHGRTSNSFNVWGANNSISVDPLDPDNKSNNHFAPSLIAMSIGNSPKSYTSKSAQDIFSYKLGRPINTNGNTDDNFIVTGVFNGEFKNGEYIPEHPEGGNLAYYLKERGYKENINLFVFNYPNEDAVIYSSKKFEKYIETLISYVRTNGSNEMKACFYNSRSAYISNKFKINLVGHSMGGIIGRYYIENLENDTHVDKLITICTPHWGSGYADTSCITGTQLHKICDHDLRFGSAMYGGSYSTTLDCNAITNNCYNNSYTLTDELKYSRNRTTKYYAISAIDYKASNIDSNNYTFEIPANFNTYQELIDYMTSKSVYSSNIFTEVIPIDLNKAGDNMVGFMSQIGWTENNATYPDKKIAMEKIFVLVDSNGGNGNNIPGIEMLNMLHNKAPNRVCIMRQVYNYLTSN